MSALAKVREKYRTASQGGAKSDKTHQHPPFVTFGTTPDESSQIFARLEPRLAAMAQRWRYTDTDAAQLMQEARKEPAKWQLAVELDESREAEFRACGVLA